MTLDRTKKYKVGDVVVEFSEESTNCWICDMPTGFVYLSDKDLLALHPVEVEEPLKWSFETFTREGEMDQNWWLGVPAWQSAPSGIDVGHWRHEVVSTRIG